MKTNQFYTDFYVAISWEKGVCGKSLAKDYTESSIWEYLYESLIWEKLLQ